MYAIGLTRYLPIDHLDALQLFELANHTPLVGEVLVRVHACAVNPIDTKLYVPKDKIERTPRILGWDAAGDIVALGKRVTAE